MPNIIEHPQPTLTVDADIFRAGDSPFIELECNRGVRPSDMYGGLEPGYPIAVCWKDWREGDQCLRSEGGMFRICARAIARVDDTFRLVSTEADLRDLFAPIESPDEALSYALLATGYSTKYDPEDYRLAVPDSCDPGPEHYQYYIDVLEDTHVVEVENGYQVNLFDSQEFGCGPHPVWSITVQVNYDGALSESST